MPPSTVLPRAFARLGVLVTGVLTAGLVGLPAAHATDPSVSLVLAPGQSGPIGTVASNTDVTPVPTCDPSLWVSFDATMAGTVHVTPDAALGWNTCSVDFQISGQSIGLIEQVSVQIVPGLSITDVAVQEGNLGLLHGDSLSQSQTGPITYVAAFTVTLSEPPTTAVTVAVATADGTAIAPTDYTSASTTVTFQPGETSKLVGVPISPDDDYERDETFSVNLSQPTDAVVVDGQGTGTILNDDPTPITV